MDIVAKSYQDVCNSMLFVIARPEKDNLVFKNIIDGEIWLHGATQSLRLAHVGTQVPTYLLML